MSTMKLVRLFVRLLLRYAQVHLLISFFPTVNGMNDSFDWLIEATGRQMPAILDIEKNHRH